MAHRRRAGARRRAWRTGFAEMAAISRDRKRGVGFRSGYHRRNDTARQAGTMKIRTGLARVGCDGFTLVEVLAALAIASVIIMASAALIRNVALFFDRGTRGVTEAERLMLAVERLAGDFGSARFVWRRTEDDAAVAFVPRIDADSGGAPLLTSHLMGITKIF